MSCPGHRSSYWPELNIINLVLIARGVLEKEIWASLLLEFSFFSGDCKTRWLAYLNGLILSLRVGCMRI